MVSEAPPFWWEQPGFRAWMMVPFAWGYGTVARRRLERDDAPRVEAPVLCIGNFTVGGSGKTPASIAFADEIRKAGYNPGFLIRGYGGNLTKPRLVDPDHDSPRATGDEPLVLARHAPVAAGTDRHGAAQLLLAEGCDFLIMDDGFQSRRLHYDHAMLVVDAKRGVGNGYVIPAGPLRAPLVAQLRNADSLLVVGKGDGADEVIRMAARAAKPIHHAFTRPRNPGQFAERRFLAFAGIGNPAKFFNSVAEAGGWVTASREFPDHHPYSDNELRELMQEADALNIDLVTTSKDAARLTQGTEAARQILGRLSVLEIDVIFETPEIPQLIIADTLDNFEKRSV